MSLFLFIKSVNYGNSNIVINNTYTDNNSSREINIDVIRLIHITTLIERNSCDDYAEDIMQQGNIFNNNNNN